MGLALMVGQISAIYACICSDAAAHMSEEIKVCSTCYYIPRQSTLLTLSIRTLVALYLRQWLARTSSAVSCPSSF
jgi:hypothetical protein